MKHIKFLAITIATIATIVSCQKYDEEVAMPLGENTLRAYAPGHGNGNFNTKVSADENEAGNIEVKWIMGDHITIYNASSKEKVGDYCVSGIDSKTGEATFDPVEGSTPDGETPILPIGSEYIAVYPSSGCNDLDERDNDVKSATDWFYPEMLPCMGTEDYLKFWKGDMWYLSGNGWGSLISMKSARFTSRYAISFSYEMSMITIECTLPDFMSTYNSTGVSPELTIAGLCSNYGDFMMIENFNDDILSSQDIKVTLVIPPTSADFEGERTVSLLYGDVWGGESIALLNKTTSTPFIAGKRYIFSQKDYLADISASDTPDDDNTWTIVDTDETAASAAQFEGLRSAINARTSEEAVALVFPNLTTLPESAFANVTCKFTISAPKVTTLGGGVFGGCTNVTSIDLPSVTTMGKEEFGGTTSLSKLTLAQNGRVTSTHLESFANLAAASVDLKTHSTNCDGLFFILADDGVKVGPFNNINGGVVGDQYMKDGASLGAVWSVSADRKSGVIFKHVRGGWDEYQDVEYAETRNKNSGLLNMKSAITKDPTLQDHHSFRYIHELNTALNSSFSGESYVEGAKNVYYLPAIEEMMKFLDSSIGAQSYGMFANNMSSTGGNADYESINPPYHGSGPAAYYTPFLYEEYSNYCLYGVRSFDTRDVFAFMVVDFE